MARSVLMARFTFNDGGPFEGIVLHVGSVEECQAAAEPYLERGVEYTGPTRQPVRVEIEIHAESVPLPVGTRVAMIEVPNQPQLN